VTSKASDLPAIILVRPQLGENIGKAARAMLNFGLMEMRIVAPRDGWPNPDAGPSAAGADVILEQAQLFDTVSEALADCTSVYATTVRKRGVTKPVLTPQEAAQEMESSARKRASKSAILFGPERSGLDSADVGMARAIITVPINPEFGSLNLAQAVIIMAYELSKTALGADLDQPTKVLQGSLPAPQKQLDDLIAHLEEALTPTGYFYPPDRVPSTKQTLRNIMTKAAWNTEEVQTLRGVLSALKRGSKP